MNLQTQTMDKQWKLLVLLLQQIAENKGLTQKQIAEKTQMHQSNISRFFALKYAPDLRIFLRIANAIGVNFFLEDKESKSDLNLMMERAMEELGRRVDKLPKN